MSGSSRRSSGYTAEEKELVRYFREQLRARGVDYFARDWHLRQLTVARRLLAGGPALEDWKDCIRWALSDVYWRDKVDHLACVERLYPKYALRAEKERKKKLIRSLYVT